MKPLLVLMDTRSNGEDFALTPYISTAGSWNEEIKVFGLGFCWGFYSIFFGIGIKLPDGFEQFYIYNKNDKANK